MKNLPETFEAYIKGKNIKYSLPLNEKEKEVKIIVAKKKSINISESKQKNKIIKKQEKNIYSEILNKLK